MRLESRCECRSVTSHPQVRHLVERVQRRTLRVGTIGLGYVGLPLALAFAEGGSRGLRLDVDPVKVEMLHSGRFYIEHLKVGRGAAEEVTKALTAGALEAGAELDHLGEPDALLIPFPTPLTPHRDPDLGFVDSTTRETARRLRRNPS